MAPLRPEFPTLLNKLAGTTPREILEDIHACSLKRRTGVSLSQMMSFRPQQWLKTLHQNSNSNSNNSSNVSPVADGGLGTPLVQSARFLQNELPIRFAHRIAELDHLPHGLSDMPHVLKVRKWYVQSFLNLRQLHEVREEEDEAAFTALISRIKTRHNLTLPYMAKGIAELKHYLKVSHPGLPMEEFPEVHHFLDRFFMSRIGIRMLIGQHVALHRQMDEALGKSPSSQATRMASTSSMIGLIDTKCSPVEVAHRAIADARALCETTYGSAPEVQVFGDPSFTFPYVPRHLHQMLLELLKNSLRAVHERFAEAPGEGGPLSNTVAITTSAYSAPSMTVGASRGKRPPRIRVVVADGVEDVTIKVSDEGGGIKRSGLPRIWSYLYSTANTPLNKELALEAQELLRSKGTVLQQEQSYDEKIKHLESISIEAGADFARTLQKISEEGTFISRGLTNGLEEGKEEEDEEEEGEESGDQAGEDGDVLRNTDEGGASARRLLAGYGYGLPISRLYARYFGGDLQIFSMEGYGTDAYLHLNRLRNVQEPLP